MSRHNQGVGGEMQELLHRITRGIRRGFKRFESSRSDEGSTWILTVNIWPDELDGGFVAQCVEVPGAISEGDTADEALANVTAAIEELLETIVRDNVQPAPVPQPQPAGETRSVKIAVGA